MAQQPQRSRPVTDWTLGEVASLFFQWLFSPAVGLLAAFQEYSASQNLSVAIAFGAFVFGMAALGVNNMRQFLVASSVKGRLPVINAVAARAQDATVDPPLQGYVAILAKVNTSQGPIEYEVLRCDVFINNTRAVLGAESTMTGVVPAGLPASHTSGIVPIGWKQGENLSAEVEYEFRYGRPGKMRNREIVRYRINFATDADSIPTNVTAFKT